MFCFYKDNVPTVHFQRISKKENSFSIADDLDLGNTIFYQQAYSRLKSGLQEESYISIKARDKNLPF